MNQQRLFQEDEAIINALTLYCQDNEPGHEPDEGLGAMLVAGLVTLEAQGPFCIAFYPVPRGGVMEAYRDLDRLADQGVIERRTHYFGGTDPRDPDYRGYGYRYRIAQIETVRMQA